MFQAKEDRLESHVAATSGKRKRWNSSEASKPLIQKDSDILAYDIVENFRQWVELRRGDWLKPEHVERALSGATFSEVKAVEVGLAVGTYLHISHARYKKLEFVGTVRVDKRLIFKIFANW